MPIYVGSRKVADTGTHGLYAGNRINAVYYGSRKVYQYLPASQTFNPSGTFQTYTVPKGCTKLAIDCVASKGNDGTRTAGNGGRVQCTLNVTPLQTLYIMVGDIPASADSASYNASDIRTNNTGVTDETSLNSRLIVAGGGGSGTTSNLGTSGGAGGGLIGETGGRTGDNTGRGGYGGTQTEGGARGGSGSVYPGYGVAGSFGIGGEGYKGGSGGAGWYGGGGGSGGSYGGTTCGGGGGGSSYTDSTLCSNIVHTQGFNDGAGYVTITPTR